MGKSAIVCAALAALALAGCEAPPTPPAPSYHCIKDHTDTDVGQGFAMYMVTGSKLMGYVASQHTVCDAWSDGQQHPEENQ